MAVRNYSATASRLSLLHGKRMLRGEVEPIGKHIALSPVQGIGILLRTFKWRLEKN